MAESDWFDYQKLAAEIYADLEKAASVTHDDRILGVQSGIERQIDVAVRTSIAGHGILIIVQAKDLARPADVNVVGEFQSVIEDVRAAKGVLICSSGFTAGAREYADKLSIDLCTVHEVRHRKWSADLRIPLLWIESDGDAVLEMELVPDQTNTEAIVLERNAAKWIMSADEGKTTTSIGEHIAQAWNTDLMARVPGRTHHFDMWRKGLKVRLGQSFWCPLRALSCTYTIKRRGWLGTFTFSQGRSIFNRNTGVMRAKVRLTDKDIPLERGVDWTEVADPDRIAETSGAILVIEKGTGPESFTFHNLEMTEEDL